MSTLIQIRNAVLDGLNDLVDNSIYPEDYIDRLINEEQQGLCDDWKWQFLRKRVPLTGTLVGMTTQTFSVGDADLYITVPSMNALPQEGGVFIGIDFITYDSFTKISPYEYMLSGLGEYVHGYEEGQQVYIVEKLPEDFNRQPEVLLVRNNGINISLNYLEEYDFYSTDSWVSLRNREYSFFSANNGDRFLVTQPNHGTQILFRYLKKPQELVLDEDVSVIPNPYATKVLGNLVVARAMFERGDNVDNAAGERKTLAEEHLLKMKKKYGEEEQAFDDMITNPYSEDLLRRRQRRITINRYY